MKKNSQLLILIILFVVIMGITFNQSMKFKQNLKRIKRPTKESRQIGDMSTHKWTTVKKLSQRYDISEQDIFKALDITPQKGDENLPLKDLKTKYNKNQEEMKNIIKKIMQDNRSKKADQYD